MLAKCAAGRERDWEYAETALEHGLVDPEELLRRAPDLPLARERIDELLTMLRARIDRAGDSR